MATLHDIIRRVRNRQTDEMEWLYSAGASVDLSLATDAELGCPDFEEDTDEELEPAGFAERDLRSTIDVNTLTHCIEWADRLSGSNDDNAALDIIRYCIRFDAWPETLNAPDPPPAEVVIRRLDREFADQLGPEDQSKPCRRDSCNRGTVKLSAFCRRHHFENIRNRAYPFDD